MLSSSLPVLLILQLLQLPPTATGLELTLAAPTTTPTAAPPKAPPKPQPVRDRVKGKAELSFVATSGNASTQTVGSSAELEYRPDGWRLDMKGAFVRTSADGAEQARTLTGEVRASRTISPRFETYGRLGYLKNTFAGIERRLYSDGGFAYRLMESSPQTLRAEAGLGYTDEDRSVGETITAATGNIGVDYRRSLTANSDFRNESSLSMDLGHSRDWRLTQVNSVSVGFNAVLSLKLSHRISYLNAPVPGFERTDTISSAAVVAQF